MTLKWWTLGSPLHSGQLNAVIKAALDLLECDNTELELLITQFYAGVWTNENHDILDIYTQLVEDLVWFSLIFSWPC